MRVVGDFSGQVRLMGADEQKSPIETDSQHGKYFTRDKTGEEKKTELEISYTCDQVKVIGTKGMNVKERENNECRLRNCNCDITSMDQASCDSSVLSCKKKKKIRKITCHIN